MSAYDTAKQYLLAETRLLFKEGYITENEMNDALAQIQEQSAAEMMSMYKAWREAA